MEKTLAVINRVKARVVPPEYLIAIMLQTSRKKDLLNAGKMLEEAKIDTGKLARILKKYGLEAKFKALGVSP